MAYPVGNLLIPVQGGRIEGILKEPLSERWGAALVLHPHPLHGGTMHNKVVFRVASALNDAGLAALRINFRGVGESTGTHDFARGERDDAIAGLDYLAAGFPNEPLTIAGFSFGARVGLEVGISDARVSNLIGIGTPVNMYDFSFLKECRKPILFVHGEKDEFGSADVVRSIAGELGSQARASIEVIPGAGHFFDGQLNQVKKIITEWVLREAKALE